MTAGASAEATALVLCGGAGRRFGGDKTRALLAGVPLLDHVLLALPTPWPVVCVGPQRPTARAVTWCREEPPGGGPVAALAAGLAHVTTRYVVVLGGDMPQAGTVATVLAAALDAHPEVDAVVGIDRDDRRQPLLAAYRLPALQRAVPHPPAGTPLMRVLDRLVTAPLQLDPQVALDVDTAADLEALRHRVEE